MVIRSVIWAGSRCLLRSCADSILHSSCWLWSNLHYTVVIYRDLKSENVVVNIDGYLKVIDFGYSKRTTRVRGLCKVLRKSWSLSWCCTKFMLRVQFGGHAVCSYLKCLAINGSLPVEKVLCHIWENSSTWVRFSVSHVERAERLFSNACISQLFEPARYPFARYPYPLNSERLDLTVHCVEVKIQSETNTNAYFWSFEADVRICKDLYIKFWLFS